MKRNRLGWASLVLLVGTITVSAAERYWIGNAGENWSATASWSVTSGGSGGASVPGAADTAIFDSNGNTSGILDASYAGTVGAVDVQSGYTGTNTQNRNLNVATNFTLATNAVWKYTADTAAALAVGSNMTVNGTIQCQRTSTSSNGTGRSFTVGGNLVVGSTGTFDADGMGFPKDTGPGKNTGRTGGSYGGRGVLKSGGPVGATYGSIGSPTALGSGGDDWSGGGAIVLSVTGASTIDGTLTANGPGGAWGSGSGGSVFLTMATFSGAATGLLRAHGGTDSSQYVHGGGGRIAVVLAGAGAGFSGYAGGMTAYGGGGGAGAGTVYRKILTQTYGDVVVNNNGMNIVGGQVTDLPAGSH